MWILKNIKKNQFTSLSILGLVRTPRRSSHCSAGSNIKSISIERDQLMWFLKNTSARFDPATQAKPWKSKMSNTSKSRLGWKWPVAIIRDFYYPRERERNSERQRQRQKSKLSYYEWIPSPWQIRRVREIEGESE